jgi:hypothetical protein
LSCTRRNVVSSITTGVATTKKKTIGSINLPNIFIKDMEELRL